MEEEIKYPCRCKIIDISGELLAPGIVAATPDISKQHIGKLGLAESVDEYVRITLDDGNIIYGYECWWTPIKEWFYRKTPLF